MPQYKNPKSGDLYDVPTKFGPDGKTDVNREKAIAKGYQPVEASAPVVADDMEEVTNPKTNQKYQIPKSEVAKAVAKGYVAANAPTPATAKDSDPSFAEETWDKIKGIPGGILKAGKDAAHLGVRVVTGRTEDGEIADRLGTLARGAGDMVQVIGDAPASAVAAVPNLVSYLATGEKLYEGAGKKETARLLDSVGLADEESLEAKDKKYPGARAVGQLLPALALPTTTIPSTIASGAGFAAAAQISDKGEIDPRELASDTIAGMTPLGVMKGASKAIEVGGEYVRKGGRALTDKYGKSIVNKTPKAEQFLDSPELIDEAARADKVAQDLSDQKSTTTQNTKDRYDGLDLENKAQTGDIDTQLGAVKTSSDAASDKINTRYEGLAIEEATRLKKLDDRIDELKTQQAAGDNSRKSELESLKLKQKMLEREIAKKAETGLATRRKETNSAYQELNQAVDDALVFAPSLNNRIKDSMSVVLKKIPTDGQITSGHLGYVDGLLNDIYKRNLPPVEQALEISKAIKTFANSTPPLDTPGANSLAALKNYSYNITNEINDVLRNVSPTLADAEVRARKISSTEIQNREFLKDKVMSKQTRKVKRMDSAKVGSRLDRAGEFESQGLQESLEYAGAGKELNLRKKLLGRIDDIATEGDTSKLKTNKAVSNVEANKELNKTPFGPQRDSELNDVTRKYNPVRERLMTRKDQIEYPELRGQLQSELRDIGANFDPRIQRERDLSQDFKDLSQPQGYAKQILGGAAGAGLGTALAGPVGLIAAEGGRRIGRNLSSGMGQIKLYNALSKSFNKPALTSMVKALASSGKPLSLAAIAALATQHKVDDKKLVGVLMDNGVEVTIDDT